MPRDIYYQSSENPIQHDRLPRTRPEMELPCYSQDPAEDAAAARRRFLALAIMPPLAAVICAAHLGARAFAPNMTLVVSTIVLLIPAICWIHRAVEDRTIRQLCAALVGVFATWACLNFRLAADFSALLAATALGGFTYLFGEHWVFLCTASPLKRTMARRLRTQYRTYLAVMACLPVVFVLIGIGAGNVGFAFLGIVVVAAYQALETVVLSRRHGALDNVLDAWTSWFSYDRTDDELPGTFQSPSGTTSDRFRAAQVAAYLVAIPPVTSLMDYPLALAGVVPPRAFPLAAALGFAQPGPVAFLLELGLALFLPVFLMGFVPVAVSLPLLCEVSQYANQKVGADNWRRITSEMRTSVDAIERKSYYVGRNIYDGSPLLVPRTVFQEHAHFLGDSGSGKTSLGIIPLLEQIIAGEPCSVVVVDLKGDTLELYATLEAAAAERERRIGEPLVLKHFTTESDRSTFAFNPLDQPFLGELDLYQKTDIHCSAMGLDYGPDYGEGYYSSANATILYQTMKRYPGIRSLREAADRVRYFVTHASRSELSPAIREAGNHVGMVLERLASIDALNVTPDSGHPRDVAEEAIDLSGVFARPQLLYYHLPYTLAPHTCPETARLVSSSLLVAARRACRRFPVYLVIDEFQRMVARNLEAMLQLARSMGVAVILANQTMEDLRTSRTNLIPAIEGNCRFRQYFAASLNEDRDRIIRASGETVDYLFGTNVATRDDGRTTTSRNSRECILPRLGVDDVLLATDHPQRSIVRISRGEGHAQLGGMACVVESDYHISREEYERRKQLRWPTDLRGTFIPRQHQPPDGAPSVKAGPVVTTEVVGHSPVDAPPQPPASPGSSEGDDTTPPNRQSKKRRGKTS